VSRGQITCLVVVRRSYRFEAYRLGSRHMRDVPHATLVMSKSHVVCCMYLCTSALYIYICFL
jgi:hypothetical protein